MPALYPPSPTSPDTPCASPLVLEFDGAVFAPCLRLIMLAPLSRFVVVKDLQPGLAEAKDFSDLPRNDSHDGAGDKPAGVEPFRTPDDEKDDSESDHLDEVGGYEHPHRAGGVV